MVGLALMDFREFVTVVLGSFVLDEDFAFKRENENWLSESIKEVPRYEV